MNKANKSQDHVGSLADMGKRFISAWKRATEDKMVNATQVTCVDIQPIPDTTTPRSSEPRQVIRKQDK